MTTDRTTRQLHRAETVRRLFAGEHSPGCPAPNDDSAGRLGQRRQMAEARQTKHHKTPRTSELLQRILARDGQVGVVLRNAPEEWVVLARELETKLEIARAALARELERKPRTQPATDLRDAFLRATSRDVDGAWQDSEDEKSLT